MVEYNNACGPWSEESKWLLPHEDSTRAGKRLREVALLKTNRGRKMLARFICTMLSS